MSRLALGTVQFGLPYGIANQDGQVSRSGVKHMLKLAKAQGIDTLDTAIAYGESETCLGEVGIHGFKLVTKLPTVPDDCVDVSTWIQKQVKESLMRLGVSSVYGVLLHRSDQLIGKNGRAIYKTLKNLKELGLAKKIGVSIYSPSDLDVLTAQHQLDMVQAPFNLIDRRMHTSGWLTRLKNNGIEIHTRSAFLQGLLLMHRSALPAKFGAWSELWRKWQDWLALHHVSAVQACIAFPLAFSEIDRVVVGADNMVQLEQIINAAVSELSDDLPDLSCDDKNLINPSHWPQL